MTDQQPRDLDELITRLTLLKALTPVEQAAAIPDLIRACQTVLGLHRGWAMTQATDPTSERYMTQAELARVLGVHRNKVADGVAAWRAHRARQPLGTGTAAVGVSMADLTTDHLRDAAQAAALSVADMPSGEEITRQVLGEQAGE